MIDLPVCCSVVMECTKGLRLCCWPFVRSQLSPALAKLGLGFVVRNHLTSVSVAGLRISDQGIDGSGD